MSIVRFSNRIPNLFDHFLDNEMFNWSDRNFSTTNTTLPAVNIKEDVKGFEVELAAPGFEKDDFKIELNNDVLSISSEKKFENETKNGEQFTKREFSYQSFCRSFSLPVDVENENISAKYENGILKIAIPKKEQAKVKAVKQIAIS